MVAICVAWGLSRIMISANAKLQATALRARGGANAADRR